MAEPSLSSQLWLQHSAAGCCSQLSAFPRFISQPAPPGPRACWLGDGFGLAFLLPGLLYFDRHWTFATAVAEVSGRYAHMIRLMITSLTLSLTAVRGRRRRKRTEINDLLYQERTNYSANLLLLILSHNLLYLSSIIIWINCCCHSNNIDNQPLTFCNYLAYIRTNLVILPASNELVCSLIIVFTK